MIIGILIFAVIVCCIGLLILFQPSTFFDFLRKNVAHAGLQVAAILARLILGWLLITTAEASRFPLVMQILGWLAIVAAVSMALMGKTNFRRLIEWALGWSDRLGRSAGALALLFGFFLIYAYY